MSCITLWEQGVVGSNPATPTEGKLEGCLKVKFEIAFFISLKKTGLNCISFSKRGDVNPETVTGSYKWLIYNV